MNSFLKRVKKYVEKLQINFNKYLFEIVKKKIKLN